MSNFEDYDLTKSGRSNQIEFYEYDPESMERPRRRPDSQSAYRTSSQTGARRSTSSSARTARPAGSRPSGSRPSGSRPSGSRPSGSRPTGSRPSSGRPSGTRPSGARPSTSRKKPSGRKGGKKKKNKKQVIIGVEIFIIVLLLIIFFLWNKFAKINFQEGLKYGENGNVQVNELDEATEDLLSNYMTIALFGVDNRSNGNYDTGNSDTIMVASINKDTKVVKIISVQRDTYLKVGEDTYRKCNYAYNHGGAEEAVSMLNTNLDLKINDYVAVDFMAMAKVVDDLGGLDIDISQSMIDAINDKTGQPALAGYIAEVEQQIYGDWKYDECFLSPGMQHLNGAQVVGYCRNRFSGDNDFARAQRQRDVVKMIVEKAKKADVSKLNKIADDVFPDISTSMSLPTILSLAAGVADYEIADSSGFPFDLTTGTYGSKGSLVVPCTLTSNVQKLHLFMYDQENYDPTDDSVDEISAKIQNDTGTSESSASKTQESD